MMKKSTNTIWCENWKTIYKTIKSCWGNLKFQKVSSKIEMIFLELAVRLRQTHNAMVKTPLAIYLRLKTCMVRLCRAQLSDKTISFGTGGGRHGGTSSRGGPSLSKMSKMLGAHCHSSALWVTRVESLSPHTWIESVTKIGTSPYFFGGNTSSKSQDFFQTKSFNPFRSVRF